MKLISETCLSYKAPLLLHGHWEHSLYTGRCPARSLWLVFCLCAIRDSPAVCRG